MSIKKLAKEAKEGKRRLNCEMCNSQVFSFKRNTRFCSPRCRVAWHTKAKEAEWNRIKAELESLRKGTV